MPDAMSKKRGSFLCSKPTVTTRPNAGKTQQELPVTRSSRAERGESSQRWASGSATSLDWQCTCGVVTVLFSEDAVWKNSGCCADVSLEREAQSAPVEKRHCCRNDNRKRPIVQHGSWEVALGPEMPCNCLLKSVQHMLLDEQKEPHPGKAMEHVIIRRKLV